MAANKQIRIGPVALTTTMTTNILNPPGVTGGVSAGGTASTNTYYIIKHIRILNKSSSQVSFYLYIGATAANVSGTEFFGLGTSISANGYLDWYGALRLDAADFLVGGASAATSLVLQAEGEIGIA